MDLELIRPAGWLLVEFLAFNRWKEVQTATATATATTATTATLWRGTFVGPPPTGHVLRFIDSGVFVLPVGGPSRSLLEVRGAPWVALPELLVEKLSKNVFFPGFEKRR